MYESATPQGEPFSWVSAQNADIGSPLIQLLMAPEIVPGSAPGYELCKTIYSYHPLGAVLADGPITRAQAKEREISVPVLGESAIVKRFIDTWDTLGQIGATTLLHDLCSTARRYGIAALAVGEVGGDVGSPLDLSKIADADLFFNILDPLNTAGSLVLNQDPNSPSFLKPSQNVLVAGVRWHPSRLFIKMHERPIFIEWTNSAFGFVGRSVYQRALYPLKTFIQTMATDQMVTQKAGLLVYKAKSPGAIIDNLMRKFMGGKRSAIKQGVTNNVISIACEEDLQTLNMQNLDNAAGFSRTNVLKNIASAAGMPASIVMQETLTEGFGEGTEDAKKEVEYLDYIRKDMSPAYAFLDAIVRRKAWTPEFYASLRKDYSGYSSGGFDAAAYDWIRAFSASWPNLLIEPDSEKAKTQDVQFKAVVAMVETVGPLLDPKNRAALIAWAAENANEREQLFASKFDFDQDALEEYLLEEKDRMAEQMAQGVQSGEDKEPKPRPFAAAS